MPKWNRRKDGSIAKLRANQQVQAMATNLLQKAGLPADGETAFDSLLEYVLAATPETFGGNWTQTSINAALAKRLGSTTKQVDAFIKKMQLYNDQDAVWENVQGRREERGEKDVPQAEVSPAEDTRQSVRAAYDEVSMEAARRKPVQVRPSTVTGRPETTHEAVARAFDALEAHSEESSAGSAPQGGEASDAPAP